MFSLISWFILCVLGGTLTLWAVWSRNITRWRTYTFLGFLATIFLSGAGILVSQGWSSPCWMLLPGKYNIIGYTFIPEKVIYLFLDTEYGPKTCSLPWSTEKAEELQKNEEEGGSEFEIGFGDGLGIPGVGDGGEPEIIQRPKQEHPPKEGEQEAQF